MKFIFSILAILGCASAQFTDIAQDNIVQAHNDLRSDIAKGKFRASGRLLPQASNMKEMTWDPELAETAQDYAGTCSRSPSGHPDIGENIYFDHTESSDSLDDLGVRAAKHWARQFEDYRGTSSMVDPASLLNGLASATQMAWADAEFVGCGVSKCGKDPAQPNMYIFRWYAIIRNR
ncbi:hypothetical protein B9Z55_015418 [Caenorhabditis nigoni]|uniref:SCP domain-containing protein n=1 Tax=Caenorhabditis nigoni TaxID=1611254 RepID=A0A2G5UA52_9PELO|nr:hypothetical protein B9Z55_015418 [Caenorhabditis nigoni]